VIAVDTSALMAVLLGGAQADDCVAVLESADRLLLSSGTLAEALIVAARRNVGAEMAMLIDGFGFEIASGAELRRLLCR
jgi:ribonuclease VapC